MDRLTFLISAPSGTGKTTIIRRVLEDIPSLRKIVTTTSRPPRSDEETGVDYHFVSRKEFLDMVGKGEFLEWKEHFGHLYGLTRSELERHPNRNAIFDMDVFGKDDLLSQTDATCVTIFLAPPSVDEAEERIRMRGKDRAGTQLRERIDRTTEELGRAETYDYLVVNRQIDDTVGEIKDIVNQATAPSTGQEYRYVCVEGLIAAGKTTLAQILAAHLDAKLHLDPFEENPFLLDFYFSKRRSALETELTFALLRHQLQRRIERDLGANRLVVTDFTMWRSQVFASVNLSGRTHTRFMGIYKELTHGLPKPDLVIWIQAPFDLLVRRIKTRGRTEEVLGISEDYLASLEKRYESLLSELQDVEVVRTSARELDMVRTNKALERLVSRLKR